MPRMTKSETMALPDSVIRRNPHLGIPTRAEAAAAGQRRLEKHLQADCERLLRHRGIECLHLSPRARERVGWPDLTFAINGQAVAVELKTPIGQVTADQQACQERLWVNGWVVKVVRSTAEFEALLTYMLAKRSPAKPDVLALLDNAAKEADAIRLRAEAMMAGLDPASESSRRAAEIRQTAGWCADGIRRAMAAMKAEVPT